MDALHRIAEARLREAIDRGDFDDLPGFGRPLALDDLAGDGGDRAELQRRLSAVSLRLDLLMERPNERQKP